MMRKTVVGAVAPAKASIDGTWLKIEDMAAVEVTSEENTFPIEHALGAEATTGWRASATGPQVVRLRFDTPQAIRRIHVHFVERAGERSQEFAIYADTGTDGSLREVVRQQWSFSPGGATEEIEDYRVDLHNVSTLELRIDPDRSHDPAKSQSYASLQQMRLA